MPEYQVTAAVCFRGILAEHHDVPVESVHYRTGGLHDSGRTGKLRLGLPRSIDVQPISPGQTLSGMLESGQIDALYSPRTPRCFLDGSAAVRRLVADPRQADADYFRAI